MASDWSRQASRALQEIVVDELGGSKPSYTHCLQLIEKHTSAARAAGWTSREQVAAYIFETFKTDFQAFNTTRKAP